MGSARMRHQMFTLKQICAYVSVYTQPKLFPLYLPSHFSSRLGCCLPKCCRLFSRAGTPVWKWQQAMVFTLYNGFKFYGLFIYLLFLMHRQKISLLKDRCAYYSAQRQLGPFNGGLLYCVSREKTQRRWETLL